MEKNVEISLLFSFYGNLLTDKQAEAVDLYYNEDLSLSEVGGELGISRQGVRDSLKRAETALYDAEAKLGLAARFLLIKERLRDIDKTIKEIEASPDIARLSVETRKKINSILMTVAAMNDMEE